MTTLQKYIKLANALDKLEMFEESAKLDKIAEQMTNARCNCENGGCEKLNRHKVGACGNKAGAAKALYIGRLCDECAALTPKEYLYPPFGTAIEDVKRASLEVEMEKEISEKNEDDEDSEDEEKTTKKKKITLSFD